MKKTTAKLKKVNIESFQHACELLSMDATLPELPGMPERFSKPLLAKYQLDVINEAQGDGFIPDPNNYDQRKWFPVHLMDEPGFRFYAATFTLANTDAGLGSRPLPTEEDAIYVGTKFIGLYAQMNRATKIAGQ